MTRDEKFRRKRPDDESVGVGVEDGGWWDEMGWAVGGSCRWQPDKGVLIIFGKRTRYWFGAVANELQCVKRCFPPQRRRTVYYLSPLRNCNHVYCVHAGISTQSWFCCVMKTETSWYYQIRFSFEEEQTPGGGLVEKNQLVDERGKHRLSRLRTHSWAGRQSGARISKTLIGAI